MLRAPRATIRAIADADPARRVWLPVVLAGIQAGLLDLLEDAPGSGLPPWASVPAALGRGAFQSVVAVVVLAFLADRVARWFGGGGTMVRTRAAIAWSQVPVAASLLVSIPAVAIAWPVLLDGGLEASPWRALPLSVPVALAMAASLWSAALLVVTVAEVQGLSVLRSVGTLVVATALVLLALVALWWVAMLAGVVALLPKFRWSF